MSGRLTPRGRTASFHLLVGAALGLILAFGASELYHRITRPPGAGTSSRLPYAFPVANLGAAPTLSGFVTQTGAPFDPSAFAGKVQVVSFLDPRGTHVSPVIAVNLLMALQSDLSDTGQFGSKVVFLSVNVDPQTSGPQQMATFLKEVVGFGKRPATPAAWAFITAPPERVGEVVRDGYGVPIERLVGRAYQTYVARQKELGRYFYATAWNPLASSDGVTVVNDGTVIIVGPHGRIRARIPRAYQVSSLAVEQTIAAVLATTKG